MIRVLLYCVSLSDSFGSGVLGEREKRRRWGLEFDSVCVKGDEGKRGWWWSPGSGCVSGKEKLCDKEASWSVRMCEMKREREKERV